MAELYFKKVNIPLSDAVNPDINYGATSFQGKVCVPGIADFSSEPGLNKIVSYTGSITGNHFQMVQNSSMLAMSAGITNMTIGSQNMKQIEFTIWMGYMGQIDILNVPEMDLVNSSFEATVTVIGE